MIDQTGKLSSYYKDLGINHIIKTQIYLAQNKLDSAQLYLDKAYKEKTKTSFGSHSDLNLLGTQNTLALLQAIIDTKKGEIFDFAPIMNYNDSIILANIRKNHTIEEQIIDKSNYEQQNVRKRKFEEIEERAETLQRLFREALSVKEEKENNSLFFRKILLQQLGIIKLIATSPVKKGRELLGQVVDISNESISTKSLLKWNDLYPIINSIYNNFHANLTKKFGSQLNEKEIQLCCLLVADFSNGEISAIMQQSLQTIYQRRSVIRKKIGVDEKQDIIAFLCDEFQTLA